MLKNIIFIGMFIVISVVNSYGQKISGKVVDETGKGISYVNIGIMNSAIGVVSDKAGNFALTLPDTIPPGVKVSFSHISYDLRSIGIREIENTISSSGKLEVVLFPEDHMIEDVRVVAGKMKERKFTRKGMPLPGVFAAEKVGSEIGSVIEVTGEIMLSKIDFQIKKNTYDMVRMRVNVYRVDSDSPDLATENMDPETDGDGISTASAINLVRKELKGENKAINRVDSALLVNILHFPSYCDIPASPKSREFSVSLNENLILSRGRYYISLEIVELEGAGDLYFPLFVHKSYIRENSMGGIRRFAFNIGLSVRGYKLSDIN